MVCTPKKMGVIEVIRIYKTIGGSITEVDSLQERNVWVDLVNPSEAELMRVNNEMGVDIDFLRAALDSEERPRIEAYDGQVLILMSMPYKTCHDFPVNYKVIPYNTIPLGIIVTEGAVVTVSLNESPLINELRKIRLSVYTQKKTRFVLQLLYNNARLFLTYLKEIEKLSTEIEHRLHRAMKNEELIKLLNLEKSLVYFTTSLRSNEIVLEKLLRSYLRKVHDEESQITVQVLKMYEEDEDLLEDVITENKQALEMGDIYTNILSGTMDAFASVISNNLNIVMKFLASITIIMAIPTVVTSFFGMNVRLPYQDYPLAYVGIIGFTFLLMFIGSLILVKKKMF